MIAILAVAVFGAIFVSGEDAQPQSGSVCSAILYACNEQFDKDPEAQKWMGWVQLMVAIPLMLPKLHKDDFNKFCQTLNSFHQCLDEKHAATECKNDEGLKIYVLPYCQSPQRQIFAEHIECMLTTAEHTETTAFSDCRKNEAAKQANRSNKNETELECSDGNALFECIRDRIVQRCGPAFYNAWLDVAGPILDFTSPGCKLTAKKVPGGAAKLASSFVMLGIGLVSARFV